MGTTSEPLTTATGCTQSFVLVCRAIRLDRGTLTLLDLAPSTVVVTWAPGRSVQAVSTSTLLDLWWDQKSTTSAEARLTLMDPGARHAPSSTLRLSAPRISGSGLRWDAVVLSGLPPTSSGSCVLVVQPASSDVQPLLADQT